MQMGHTHHFFVSPLLFTETLFFVPLLLTRLMAAESILLPVRQQVGVRQGVKFGGSMGGAPLTKVDNTDVAHTRLTAHPTLLMRRGSEYR